MDSNHIPVNLVLEDRYELLERIGEGGMAMVYKALDRRLNRYVAVKIMRPEMSQDEEVRQRFFAESHAVARLSSPNIVAVYDVNHSGARAPSPGGRRCISPSRPPGPWPTPTRRAWCTGTSSPRTCCCCGTAP